MPAAASIPPTLTTVPSNFNAQSSGNVSFDHEYFYVKYNGWRRFPLVRTQNLSFGFPDPSHEGNIYTDNQYFYLVVNHQWKKFPIFIIKPRRPIMGKVPMINIQETKLTTFPSGTDNYGRWGMISFNNEYFCIWGQGKWHKIPITRMPKFYSKEVEEKFVRDFSYEDILNINIENPPQGNITLNVGLM
jgi:hypothetical protein